MIVAGYYIMPSLFLRAVGGISASYAGRTVTFQALFDKASSAINSELAEVGASGFKELFTNELKAEFDEIIAELWSNIMY